MGIFGAVSPAIFTSANSIGPHEYDVSPYWRHSNSGLPLSKIGVSVIDPSVEGRMRKPIEPVSTSTLSMVAQFGVPCWQTVTVVNIRFGEPPACPLGPNPTVTPTVLLTGVVLVIGFAASPELLLPHPANMRQATTGGSRCAALFPNRIFKFNASPPRER